MKRLLWETLFFRLLSENKKLFAMAALTVSLGVALALGIRLGTQSAIHSLVENTASAHEQAWSDVLLAHSPQGKNFLKDLALREGALIFSTLDAKLTAGSGGEQSSKNIQLQILWSDAESLGTLTTPETESRLMNADDVPSDVLKIFIPSSCLGSLQDYSYLQAQGMNRAIQYIPLKSLTHASCQVLTTTPDQITSREALSNLHSLALGATFPTRTAEQKHNFENIKKLAVQIPGMESDVTQRRLSRLNDVTLSFRTNLQLMGFIALFIGFAMVHHIFTLLLARQSKTLSTLSALGISVRRQISILLCVSAVIGVAASATGTLLGLVAGQFLSQVTSDTVKNLYDSLVSAEFFHWKSEDILYGFFLGFFACFLGSLQPVLRLQTLPVAQIMREGSFEAHDTGLSARGLISLTLAITMLSLACLKWTVVWDRVPITALIACLGFLVVTALLAQLICRGIYFFAQLARWQSRTATQLRIFLSPQAAVVIQVLTLTFTLTFGVKGMAESFRKTLADWSRDTLKADVWIRAVGGGGAHLPDEVLRRLDSSLRGETLAVDRLSLVQATLVANQDSSPKPMILAGARFSEQAKVTPMRILSPVSASDAVQKEMALKIASSSESCSGTENSPCGAYISEPLLVHFKLKPELNETLCPDVNGQKICFKIEAVYQDFGSDQGVLLTDESVLTRLLFSPPKPSFSNVYFTEPRAIGKEQKLIVDLQRMVEASNGSLAFETLDDLQKRILTTFDNTFRITDALYILCSIVAVISTVSCLNLQILLRSREWSLQWALGIGEDVILKRFSWWSAWMAMLAALASLAGGWVLSAVLVYAVNYYSFGYSLSLFIPWQLPILIVTVATLSGFLSGKLQSLTLRKNMNLSSLARE